MCISVCIYKLLEQALAVHKDKSQELFLGDFTFWASIIQALVIDLQLFLNFLNLLLFFIFIG